MNTLSQHDGSLNFVLQCTELRSLYISRQPDMNLIEPQVDFPGLSVFKSSGWGLAYFHSRIASAPNLVHLALDGYTQLPFATQSSKRTIASWPSFSRLVTMNIQLQHPDVDYLKPTLERCSELVAIHVEGPIGFYHLLQILQHDGNAEHGGVGVDGSPAAKNLCPKLKLLRMWAQGDTRASAVDDPATAQEAFENVWPLMQDLLLLRPFLVVWIWTVGLMTSMPVLWTADEVKALTADHLFGERLHIVGALAGSPNAFTPSPPPLCQIFESL